MIRLRPTSLRARLLVLVCLAVIPALGLVLYAGLERRREAASEVRAEALQLALNVAADHERLVIETRQFLALLVQVPQVREMRPPACFAFLADLLAQGGPYAGLGVLGPDGITLCTAPPTDAPVDASHRPCFQRAMETADFSIGDYQIGLVTGVASVNFGYPILDGDSVRAVALAALPLTWIQERLATAGMPPGSTALVTDATRTILAKFPAAGDEIGGTLAGTSLGGAVEAAGDEDSTFEAIGLDGVRRLYGSTPLTSGGNGGIRVSVGIPAEVAYAAATGALLRNLGLLALTVLLIAWVTWWSSGVLVLAPVKKLLGVTRRLASGDLSARAAATDANSELDELAYSFNEMAAALQIREGEIREHLEGIRRLNRVYAVLSGIDSAILRIRDREELLEEACRLAVEKGEFAVASIVEFDRTTGRIHIAAQASANGGAAERAILRISDVEPSRAPPLLAAALRDGVETVVNDLGGAEDWGALTAQLRTLGFGSTAVLPLWVADEVAGAMSLFATEPDFFTAGEMRLLRELAADTSLGLEYIGKEEHLHLLANYDPLTDLANRSLYVDRLSQALARARAHGETVAVILVQVDPISEINATLGHAAGDLVLQGLARFLAGASPGVATVARMGSGEFGVLLPEAAFDEVGVLADELAAGPSHFHSRRL